MIAGISADSEQAFNRFVNAANSSDRHAHERYQSEPVFESVHRKYNAFDTPDENAIYPLSFDVLPEDPECTLNIDSTDLELLQSGLSLAEDISAGTKLYDACYRIHNTVNSALETNTTPTVAVRDIMAVVGITAPVLELVNIEDALWNENDELLAVTPYNGCFTYLTSPFNTDDYCEYTLHRYEDTTIAKAVDGATVTLTTDIPYDNRSWGS